MNASRVIWWPLIDEKTLERSRAAVADALDDSSDSLMPRLEDSVDFDHVTADPAAVGSRAASAFPQGRTPWGQFEVQTPGQESARPVSSPFRAGRKKM